MRLQIMEKKLFINCHKAEFRLAFYTSNKMLSPTVQNRSNIATILHQYCYNFCTIEIVT